jgi:hypothetical protein
MAEPGDTRDRDRTVALRDRWRRMSGTALVLLPVCFLFLYGLVWHVLIRHRLGFDDRLFISVGQGVLSHGYPFETIHAASGVPFYDHTPLFAYLLTLPAALADPFGLEVAVTAGQAMSAVFGLATVILAFLVCRDVRGTVSGVVAAVLIATNPFFLKLSWVMHMEVPMAFFLVLGMYFLVHRRLLWAGLAIAAAVMLKEHALGFWLVAGGYVLVRHGWRAALPVTLPTVVALAAWGIAAYLIDEHQFRKVLNRWLISAGGENPINPRFQVPVRRWILTIARDTVGPPLAGITIVAMAAALARRTRVPVIAVVPIAYSALAIVASFAIHLKEERWLIGVIPMAALATGLLVDWGAVARGLARRDVRRSERGALRS